MDKKASANQDNVQYTEDDQDAVEYIDNNVNLLNLQNIIPVIWFIGSFVIAIILAIVNIALAVKVRKSEAIEDNRLNDILYDCKRKLGISKEIKVCLLDRESSPCIYGIVHPKILVPRDFLSKDDIIIRNVFLHEIAHYKRKDMITNFILLLVTILHWFNPLAYVLFRRIRTEMELATDELALKRMDKSEKKQYGFTLISLLQTYDNNKEAFKVLCIVDSHKNMEQRIRMIKRSNGNIFIRIVFSIISLMIIMLGVLPFMIKTSKYDNTKTDYWYNKAIQYMIKERTAENNDTNKKDFQLFTDFKGFGVEKQNNVRYVYMWILDESYYVEDNELVSSSGNSMLYKFKFENDVFLLALCYKQY